MAIYHHREYSRLRNSSNFGNDLDPSLLGALFDASIIESSEICIVGIGTILNDRHIAAVSHYQQKVVFSSDAAGAISTALDPTWAIACVRGQLLRLASRRTRRYMTALFSCWTCIRRKRLHDVMALYSFRTAPNDVFIDVVRSASLVLTEAMHGAILADVMRTPWIAVTFLHHNRFKWEARGPGSHRVNGVGSASRSDSGCPGKAIDPWPRYHPLSFPGIQPACRC
jgi:succinoglycan biosynthesis protein ExoV